MTNYYPADQMMTLILMTSYTAINFNIMGLLKLNESLLNIINLSTV